MPHTSPLQHLVRPTAEKICYACHSPEETQRPAHPRVTRVDCLLCHRGHESAGPHLLKEEIRSAARPAGPGEARGGEGAAAP